ncbi:helix-turn-helix domain-containing protein [Bordetella petrii]|nr:helix-turn-helix domain-containing protein [Bordetella petrii]
MDVLNSHPSIVRGRSRLSVRAFEMAARLRSRRKNLRLTCSFVADRLGIPAARYRFWEKQFGPTAEKQYLEALAQVLQTSPEWLAHGTGVSPIPADQVESARIVDSYENRRATESERIALGQRAQARRLALELSRQEISLRIGVATYQLANWERVLPLKPKVQLENKWEEVLGVPVGWLRQIDIEAPVPSKEVVTQIVEANTADSVAAEIRVAGAWLCRASFAHRTILHDELSLTERRLADIFALRYGVGGEEHTTLQAIGDRYGLTRERIRQIVEKMVERTARMQLLTPHIDRLAEEIRPLLPATVEAVDTQLRGRLGERLSIESVSRFCREILGRNIVALTDRPAEMAYLWSPTVIDPETHDVARIRAAREAALRLIRSCGAAQAMFVAGAASEITGMGMTPDEVMQGCRMVPGFEWLSERDGWFWFGEGNENRLVTIALKVLAVSGRRVDAEEILASFIRARRGYYPPEQLRPYLIEPPLQIVVEVLRRVKGLKNIQSDDFLLDKLVPVETVLSDAELAVYNLMRDNGNIISRHTLVTELVKTGKVKLMALHVSLNSSPIYRQLDRGVFALRGATLNPASLRDAQNTVGGEASKSARISERDKDGYYHFIFELTEYMVRTRVWEVPRALDNLIAGDGNLFLQGSEQPVVLAHLPSGSCRLKQFVSKLLQQGFVAGDILNLTIHPEKRLLRVTKVGSTTQRAESF